VASETETGSIMLTSRRFSNGKASIDAILKSKGAKRMVVDDYILDNQTRIKENSSAKKAFTRRHLSVDQ
jgi:hypothetical protein